MFGLLLSAIGLSDVTAYAVAERQKKIRIRMVPGATRAQVLVLRGSVALIGAGSVIGFLGAAVIARLLSSITTAFGDVFSVGTGDPRLLIGAPLLLGNGAIRLRPPRPQRHKAKPDPGFRQERGVGNYIEARVPPSSLSVASMR